MIGHDDPGQKTVLHAVMVPQVVLHQLGNPSITQVTCAVAQDKVVLEFQLLLQVVFDGHERFPLATTLGWE